MAALQCHKSQFGRPTAARVKRMKDRCKELAKKEKFQLGEAFHRLEMQGIPPAKKRATAHPHAGSGRAAAKKKS